MMQSEERQISLDMIRTDGGDADREKENPSIIQRYAQVMQDGGNYPSVMCFFDGKDYRLIYGFNLLKAAEVAGQKTIRVDVHPDPSSPQRKSADKDRVVKSMLSLLELMGEEEKQRWSWPRIAKRCNVNDKTVRNKAKELEYELPEIIERYTKNGNSHCLNRVPLGQHNKLNSKGNGFNWTAIDDKQFERLVRNIVKAHHPVEIQLRSGTGGKGRDIQAKFISKGSLGEHREEVYFIEAKHHQSGLSPEDISGALTWAQAEQPSALVIAVSSHLTNPCKETYIPSWRRNNPKVRVILWEREDIEDFIKFQPSTRELAIRLKIIAKSSLSKQMPKLSNQVIEEYQNLFIEFLEKMGNVFGVAVDTNEVRSKLLDYGFSSLAQRYIGKSHGNSEVGSLMETAFRMILEEFEQQNNI